MWDVCFRKTSPLLNRGAAQYSTLSGRVYVESMVHDRWTVNANYTAPPIMGITMEGVYQNGPAGCCNTEEDYAQMGMDMGWAMVLYLDALSNNKSGSS